MCIFSTKTFLWGGGKDNISNVISKSASDVEKAQQVCCKYVCDEGHTVVSQAQFVHTHTGLRQDVIQQMQTPVWEDERHAWRVCIFDLSAK